MRNTISLLIILFSFIFFQCAVEKKESIEVDIANKIIESCSLIDSNFIILEQKQGLFEYDSVGNDTVVIIFNTTLVSRIERRILMEKFNLNDFVYYDENDNIEYYEITGEWSENKIQNLNVIPFRENLKTEIDSFLSVDWKSYDEIETKNFCIFSEPIFSKDRMTVIQGLQIFTDSLYYLNYYELRKLPDWTVIGEVSSRHKLVETVFSKSDESEIEIGLSITVFDGYI